MNLAQLHYFRKLAQLEHYTQAAQELFISQPSLSASISSMEEELSIKLFQKKGRNVKLTKDGREFYDYVCRALDTLQDGIETAWERSGMLSGVMDVAASPFLFLHFLPDLIADYQAASSLNIQFHLHSAPSLSDLSEKIRDNTYDLGFSANPAGGSLASIPLCSHALSAFVPTTHPLAKHSAVRPSDLQDFPLLTYRDNTPMGHAIHHALQQHQLSPAQTFEDEITRYAYLSMNPELVAIAPAAASDQRLVEIPLQDFPQNLLSIYLIYSRENHICKAMGQFLSFLETHFSLTEPIVPTAVSA